MISIQENPEVEWPWPLPDLKKTDIVCASSRTSCHVLYFQYVGIFLRIVEVAFVGHKLNPIARIVQSNLWYRGCKYSMSYISVQSFFIYIFYIGTFFFGGGGYLVFERARELRGTGGDTTWALSIVPWFCLSALFRGFYIPNSVIFSSLIHQQSRRI